ncbi:winged helix-turn-helix domain-containing protein [Pseudomonas sp. HR96]|uniref:winged helix-turn-helix domain-containing protein n=1 Tax=Pseudomonas sp. HR96 TaxID=1027966 RepID=UPI0039BE8200
MLTIKTGYPGGFAQFDSQLYQLELRNPGGLRRVDLGYAGSRVLERLLQQPGEVISRMELLRYAWADRVVSQGSLSQQIYTLRQLLGDEKQRRIIQTLPRRGYLLNPAALAAPQGDAATEQAAESVHAQASLLNRLWTRLRASQQ